MGGEIPTLFYGRCLLVYPRSPWAHRVRSTSLAPTSLPYLMAVIMRACLILLLLPNPRGHVVRSLSRARSSPAAARSGLRDFPKKEGVVGISGLKAANGIGCEGEKGNELIMLLTRTDKRYPQDPYLLLTYGLTLYRCTLLSTCATTTHYPPPPSPQTHTLHTISLLYYLVACYPDIIGRLKIVYAHSSSEYNGAMTVYILPTVPLSSVNVVPSRDGVRGDSPPYSALVQ